MSLGTYVHAKSPVHAVAAGHKVIGLLVGGTALLLTDSLWVIGAALLAIVFLSFLGRIPARTLFAQIRPAFWIFLLIFLFQLYARDVAFAATVVLRLSALLLLASLVTLTTPASVMIDAMERGLTWLRWFGINPTKVSLGFSLTLRFIPVIAAITAEVREAQKARGLEWSIIAIATPVIIRTLKMADDVANAIDARGYDP